MSIIPESDAMLPDVGELDTCVQYKAVYNKDNKIIMESIYIAIAHICAQSALTLITLTQESI